MGEETCRIGFVITRRGNFTTHMRFEAEGERGLLARSEVFAGDYSGPHKHKLEHAAALRGLVEQLEADGWREMGQGERWYERYFARTVKQ